MRSRVAELPLLLVGVLLLSTAADILPNDTIVGVGEVELNLARLLVLVALAAVVVGHGFRLEQWRTGLALPLLLLLAAGLYTSHKYGTYPRYRFLVESVAVFYLTFAMVRVRADEARDGLAFVGLVALSIAALTAVAQVAQDVHTGFYRDGCTPLTLDPGVVPPSGSIPRATGTFANPNVLGGYLLLLLPVGVMASAYVTRVRGLWAAVALGGGLGFLSIVFTFSRAAVLMSLVAAGLGVLVSDVRHRRWLILVVVLLAVGIGTLAGSCGSDSTASYGRTEEWRQTLEVIRDNPVWGVGLGRLGSVLQARDPASSARHAHNLWLTWWAEAGTGALVAWIWLCIALLWRSLRAALRGSAAARAGLVALLGFFGFSMLDHPANTDRVALAFWIVAGFTAAVSDPGPGLIARLRRRRGGGRGGPPEPLDLEHKPSLVDRARSGNVRPLPPHPTSR
jgi:putative inorganic carbon (hco3(-)) transporter